MLGYQDIWILGCQDIKNSLRMGEIEIKDSILSIHARIITYGSAADSVLTERIRHEIEWMWNEPGARVPIKGREYLVQFLISAVCIPDIDPLEVVGNTDPRNNYFRIEEKAFGNISFVDGLGCNTGYFQANNLYEGSTTAAHEFGHTLGLDHPFNVDLRGKGRPGIMYPRGTLTDPQYQYDPSVAAGLPGGTMHPMHRRVTMADIQSLQLHRLRVNNGMAVIGDFTNVYHSSHD
jgi:hypothetical protein